MDEKFEEAPIFEPRNSGFRNVSMTNIETKGIKTQIGKAVSILVTLKNDPIVRYHGQSIAKNTDETAQSRSSSRFFLFSVCI